MFFFTSASLNLSLSFSLSLSLCLSLPFSLSTPNISSEPSVSPVEMRPRSQSAGQRTATPPRRLTPRQFIDYDRKKEEAQKGKVRCMF